MATMVNSIEKGIVDFLKRSMSGLTITELVSLSGLSRSTVRVALAKLEGANEVSFRNIGMAKVYALGGNDE